MAKRFLFFGATTHSKKCRRGAQKKKELAHLPHHTTLRCRRSKQRALINYSNTLILILNTRRITLRPRTPNQVGEDNYCRGGIVNTRGFALCVSRSPTALWRFRFKQCLMWPHTHTPFRQIDRTYAQQDIRVCGGDHFEMAFSQGALLRVSI